MKSVFITGLTGLLGTNLAEDLLEKGYRIKALVRDISKFQEFKHRNLVLIQEGLFDNITQHLGDVDVFIHIATETSQNLTKYTDYSEINVKATRHLYKMCKVSGIKKFIFISTANTLGHGSLNNLGNENLSIISPFTKSFYAKSKLEAEDFLLAQNDEMKTIILNPTFMIGRYDSKPSSGKIILMALNKKIIFYPSGGKNFVDVKDVSQAIIKSLKHGQHGEKYLIANENLTYKEFYKRLNFLIKQEPIMLKIPKPLLISIGYFGDILRFLNIKTDLSSTNMKILCINNFYNNEKSIKLLKLEYKIMDDAIKNALDYFEKKNFC